MSKSTSSISCFDNYLASFTTPLILRSHDSVSKFIQVVVIVPTSTITISDLLKVQFLATKFTAQNCLYMSKGLVSSYSTLLYILYTWIEQTDRQTDRERERERERDRRTDLRIGRLTNAGCKQEVSH